MPASTVNVYYADGSAARNVKVVLGFSSGMSRPAYTDGYGVAQIEHASRGVATVYASGQNCGRFHAPGRTTVNIR